MPQFTKGKWKYIPVLYQVVSFPEGKEFDIVDGAHVFWDNNAPALWHEITGEINGLNNSDEEAHANGRLIAAAPDMYEATVSLWHLLNFFRAVFPEDMHKDLPEKISNVEKLLARIDGNSEQKGGEV